MKLPIFDSKIKTLFFYIFSMYFLIGIHFYADTLGGYGLYLPHNIVGWIFITLLISIGIFQVISNKRIYFSPFFKYSFLGVVCLLLPIIFQDNELLSWSSLRMFGLIGGMLFYFSLLQFNFSKKEKCHLLYIILAGIFLESLLGICQYYFFSTNNWMNYNTQENFPYGIFKQRNVMGVFMCTGCAISIYLINNDDRYFSSEMKRALTLLMPFTASIILVGVKSKAAFLGYILFFIFMAFKLDINKQYTRFWIFSSLIGLLFGLYSPDLFERKFSEKSLQHQTGTISNRLNRFETTLKLWMQKPILGNGYGSFTRKYREFHAYRFANEDDFNSRESFCDHPHNEILYWVVEGGIIAAIGLIIFAGGYLVMIFRVNLKNGLCFLSLVTPILVMTQTGFPFYSSTVHWITFLFLIFFAEPVKIDYLSVSKVKRQALVLPAVTIPLCTSIYMFSALHTSNLITKFERDGLKDYSLLTNVSNPNSWKLKYSNYSIKKLSEEFEQNQNEKKLEELLTECNTILEYVPLLHIFKTMERALILAKKDDEAKSVRDYARYLYADWGEVWSGE